MVPTEHHEPAQKPGTQAEACTRPAYAPGAPPASELFRRLAARASNVLGSPTAFVVAVVLVLLWAAAGPYFEYSNAWQLVINTSTTIATFLMLFVLQSTQNRDTKALNIKLDELLRAIEGARTGLLADMDHVTDADLERLEREFRRLARAGRGSPATERDSFGRGKQTRNRTLAKAPK